jgi:hypothetical protein
MKIIVADQINLGALKKSPLLEYRVARWGTRGYDSAKARAQAIKQFRKSGLNHFVCYRDVQSDFALVFGWCDWVAPGSAYIAR